MPEACAHIQLWGLAGIMLAIAGRVLYTHWHIKQNDVGQRLRSARHMEANAHDESYVATESGRQTRERTTQ
eukprot:7450013-Alexandrium_andersonii.AAC.1